MIKKKATFIIIHHMHKILVGPKQIALPVIRLHLLRSGSARPQYDDDDDDNDDDDDDGVLSKSMSHS